MIELTWRVKQYLKYKLFAKHRKGHGIHPPFVYELIRNVFLDKSMCIDFEIVESYRRSLKKSHQVVEINDLGAGSKKLKSAKRKVKDIAKTAAVKKKYGKLLYRLVNYLNSDTILELGTSLGIAAHYLALANQNNKVYSIESNYQLIDIVLDNFQKTGINNVKVIEGNFDNTLPALLKDISKLDFVFIDGNHTKAATLNYFELLKPKLHNSSCVIFDDIYLSREMNEAWNEIKEDMFVRVSIDIYQFGIVFFRKESSKQDFVIKY